MLIANETFSLCLLKLEEKFMHKIKLFLTVGNKFYRNTLRKIKNLPILKTHTRTKKILERWNSQYRTKEIIKIPSAGVKKNTGARVSFDTKAKLEIPENRGKNGHRSRSTNYRNRNENWHQYANPCELTRNYFHVSSQRAAFEVDHLRPATSCMREEEGGGEGAGITLNIVSIVCGNRRSYSLASTVIRWHANTGDTGSR